MTSKRVLISAGAALLAAALAGLSQDPQAPGPKKGQSKGVQFTTLPGFAIERAVPADKLDSLIVLTFDSFGRPVVSKEQDSPRTLFDNDKDGVFESEKVFSNKVRGCQGLWFEGRTLYGACEDEKRQAGMYRMEDKDGDDAADTFEQLNVFEMSMGEHGPHAIRRGPDGHPTVMLGNHTGVPDALIDPMSPLANSKEGQLLERYDDPRGHAAGIMAPGGTVSRFNRTRGNYTILFGGFRNAYDVAFNLAGEYFTYDSDMEWDINMPWYREVRSVHATMGADFGWRHGSGKLPAYMLETLPPMRDLGRGSPVGVEFYQHHVYPRQYHDAFFEADWSRGRLLWTGLQQSGATYKARADRAEFVHGEPLNITDVEVGPDGMVYFVTGGRGTEGGVFRVRYRGRATAAAPKGVLAVVRQPQPLSSWGWEALENAKASMGEAWGAELEKLARDTAALAQDRVQALLILQRHKPAPNAILLGDLSRDKDATVRAAATYVVGMHSSDRAKAVAAPMLKDPDPFVRRRAAEAIVRMGLSADKPSFAPVGDIYALLGDPDRFLRYAGRLALERTPRGEWKDRALSETNPTAAMEGMVALIRTSSSQADLDAVVKKQLEWLRRSDLPVEDELRLVRAFQLAALEMKDGAPSAVRRQVHEALAPRFPGRDESLNRELARTLAYCGQPEAIGEILAAMPQGETNPQLQIHYMYCARAIEQGWTKAQKDQFVGWFPKSVKWRGGASFGGYLNLVFESGSKSYTEPEKLAAYKVVPQFAPLTAEEAAAMRGGRGGRGGGQQKGGGQAPATAARAGQAAPVPPPPAQKGGGGFAGRGPRIPALARLGMLTVSKQEIMENILYFPSRQQPSAEQGRQIFEKDCGSCHRFGPLGTDFGPDLTTLNRRFTKKDILESLFFPSKVVSDQYESTIIETKDNDILNGLVLREDRQKVTMKTAEVERPIEIPKSNIKSRRKSKVSIMPEGLMDEYTQGQAAGLLAFLHGGPPTAAAKKR